MRIVSTNIAKPRQILINGKNTTTGIFKEPTTDPIYLGKEIVKNDEVSNRKHHGGEFKACYLFSANHYPHWKNLYPKLDWNYGMLGENLTIEGLDDTKILIGDIYKVGGALIEITQPREPCSTFGAKMGSMAILKQFIDHARPGTYVRVLEEGLVKTGDTLELVKRLDNSVSTTQFFNLLFDKEKNQEHLKLAIQNHALPEKKRNKLKAYLK